MNFQMRTRVYNDTQSYLIFGSCLLSMLRDRTLFWNICLTGKESITYEAFQSLSFSLSSWAVSLSYCNCNKLPQSWWVKQHNFIIILEVRSPTGVSLNKNQDVSRAVLFSWESRGEFISFPFTTSRDKLQSLAHGSFLHPQIQLRSKRVESFSHCITLTLFLPPSITFNNSWFWFFVSLIFF